MENTDKILFEKIENLEKENQALRNTNVPVLFSFDFLFDAVKQPAFVLIANKLDNIPKIQKVNKSGVELVKYSQQEIENLSPIDLGLFNNMEQYLKFSTSLTPNESAIFLSHVKDKNGTAISSEITIYSFTDTTGYHLIVFQRSIGNQQKVVEALRQSEYRFLQMAENIAEGIIILEDDKKVFINSSICQITGFSKDELRDIDEFGLALDSEKERLRAFKEKLKDSSQGMQSFEFWISTKMGVEKCIKNNYTLSKRTDGKQSTYIITSDVTARKRIEQALRKSQTDFRMLAENSPDLITRYNKDLTYLYVNKTFETLTGIPINQFIGRNNLELDLEPELVSFLEEMHLEVFRTGRTLKFEFRLPTKTETKVFQAHMVPELSKDGTVDSVLNVSRDITQIKQVERNLKEEKQNLIQENFLISKQLRQWCNKLCTSQNVPPDAENCLKPILRIADWAQYGHAQENFSPRNLFVNKLLKDFFETNTPLIQANKLDANIILPVHDISIFTDEALLKNTLLLLLENAIDATATGKIEIGYDIYNEHEIVFFIKDTGIGIEPENTELIFNPFISLNKENHAGLGLSIAQKNVETMGGIIWCLSSPGTGSTFCFTHKAMIEKSLLQSKMEIEHLTWKGKKVLIVEDTNENYDLLVEILKKYELDLTRSKNGLHAIETVKSGQPFDLVLMDIQLPGMNGYDATTEIRTFNKKIPIIAQTAYAMYDDVVKALDAGCNDFIAKPIKTKKLIGLMDKYLSD